MTTRSKAAPKKKPAAKKAAPPPKKVAALKKPATPLPLPPRPGMPMRPLPGQLARPIGPAAPLGARPAAKPAAKPAVARPGESPARQALAQQAEERRKAATRKLFARLRSLEAIIGADLRKRGSLLLSQAVDQWYAEAISATATDVSITNAARAVISHI
ncbi:MAG TPA: hypothetical protein VGR52_12615 [Stellaceae bacterium]|nr:hypothetical protein [Alphaproteobacteria bacterium]MDE1930383.1 hypothetical protein [Alphaproteobacteria bacterium]HEV2163058.1 hypothetical protein [Stellaceae bacterium]